VQRQKDATGCRVALDVVCDGDACVVTGTTRVLHKAIDRCDPGMAASYSIRPTTAMEILAGIGRGGAYAFDELAYQRFLTPARRKGLPIEPEDFSDPGPIGLHFVHVQFHMPFEPIGF